MTAPELEREFVTSLPGVTELTLDLVGLDYISSAGLRVLLWAQKQMNKQGSMKLIHVNEKNHGNFRSHRLHRYFDDHLAEEG